MSTLISTKTRFFVLTTGIYWGGEKEVMKVLKLDPLNIPLHFYDFKNLKLTIISLRSERSFFN
jgi:hypothetical protein